MFKRIINYKGFWKSVLILGVSFGVILFLLKWAFSGFSFENLSPTPRFFIGWAMTSLFYGLIMTFIKFWAKLKEKDNRSK
ncbi:hypothetical protein ULMS_24440 [Patiriisocius marinistellae]|uniref:Uncharacterized protein n=1 Tax=Patiriisocius marinistellae TaxID=2494560 RepID=A0A5J4G2I9_9FLAO|nr:hypothetical protein ULMS_24440 [Patiriisocius marinistellae]